ncbi:hypothetical protein ACHHRT_10410 [Desulfurivibrio sp. D14AmB]|uniref:hypothetical protein n=1 Tax=Desulfurivibrio sp. D14AmB TaxID=3374370 RepID=UPI00376EA6F9
MNLEHLAQKIGELKESDLVCYCAQFTRKQIEEDYVDNGRSTILEKIADEKKGGGCDCARKNPKGR